MAQKLYCEQGDLMVPAKALAGVPPENIAKAISSASSDADGFLRKRYDLPLQSYTRSLTQAVADIATFYVMQRRGFTPDSDSTKQIVDAYKAALAWLDKVASNKVDPAFVDANGEGQDESSPVPGRSARPFTYYANSPSLTGAGEPFAAFWNGKRGW